MVPTTAVNSTPHNRLNSTTGLRRDSKEIAMLQAICNDRLN